jgi:flagellar hook-associated protein 2
MGIALSGLASGFDWKSLVDQLVEVSRAPQNRMRVEQQTNTKKSSALDDIRGKLATLQSSLSTLSSPDSFLKKGATIADTNSNWTATATKDTPAGDYNVEMMSLATTTVLRGRPDIGEAVRDYDLISQSWLGSTITAGTFTINGKQITIDPATQKWGDIVKSIENSGAGVFVDWNRRNSPYYQSFKDDLFTLKTGSANWPAGTDWQTWGNSPPPAPTTSSGSINLGAANDTSNFLQVLRLYNSGVSQNVAGISTVTTQIDPNSQEGSIAHGMGMLRLDVPLANALPAQSYQGGLPATFGNQAGSFKVNGETIAYNTSSTVQQILDQITASAAGVSATYDRKYDQIVLQNKTPGNVAINIDVTGDNGSVADGLGLIAIPASNSRYAAGGTISQTIGQNATFRINGGGILQAQSSTLTETDHGIKGLTINANSSSPVSGGVYTPTKITVAGDNTAAKEALNNFIKAYNDVQNTIENYTKVTVNGTKVTSSILSGNQELSSLARSMRSSLFQDYGGSGTVKRMSDLGVKTAGIENTISLADATALESKLASASSDVTNFLQTATTGFVARFKTILGRAVAESGSAAGGFKTTMESLRKQNTSLDKQIEDMERRLTAQRSMLESSFIAMETAQSRFQQQSGYLAKAFAGNN